MNCYEFVSANCVEVIIVGGGTCGLAVAARLCEDSPGSIYTEDEHQRFHWLQLRGRKTNLINKNISKTTLSYKPEKKFSPCEIMVLDAVDNQFLGQWDRQFKTCSIPYLRSPMFFHPDPVDVDGMVIYAHLTQREGPKDLKEIENVVGKEYSKHKQKRQRAKTNKKKMGPVPTGLVNLVDSSSGLIDINMRDWKDYYRPSTPFFRDFCQSIMDRYELHNIVKKDKVVHIEYAFINIADTNESGKGFVIRTESGQIYCSKACVVTCGHAGEINYPIIPFESAEPGLEGSCHTTHIFQQEVSQFPDARVMRKVSHNQSNKLVIVGGGLTSAQLVDVAIKSGVEKCYLVLRGPIKIKHFDFHLDWVTKYKNVKKLAFYMLDSDEERHQMIQEAREGGSVNPEYYKKTMQHVKSGKLELLRFTTIEEQKWDAINKTWDLTLRSKPSKNNSLISLIDANGKKINDTLTHLSDVDYIYFATGISPNLKKLGFLDSLIDKYPIDIVKGLPVLTDNLQWNNEVPLFMSGKNAQLKMGPSSANLDGARLGAERVGWALQEMRSKGVFNWNQPPGDICTIGDCPVCDDDKEVSRTSSRNSSVSTTASVSTTSSPISSFETRLKLSGGEMNWFSLLDVE